MHLIILGAQGSGKGTQASLLTKQFNLAYFAMGDALRAEVQRESPEGKKIKEILDRGELVPNTITNKLIKKFVHASENYLIDGYPRNMEQAQFFDAISDVDAILLLKISDDTVVDRLEGRRLCPNEHIYHIRNKPPQKPGVCDEDGLPLKQRTDDTEAAIRKRLSIFHDSTRQVLAHYKDKVIEINGEQHIDAVHREIARELKKRDLC